MFGLLRPYCSLRLVIWPLSPTRFFASKFARYIQPRRKPLVKRSPAGRCQPVSSSAGTGGPAAVPGCGACALTLGGASASDGTFAAIGCGCCAHGSHAGSDVVGCADTVVAVVRVASEARTMELMVFMVCLVSLKPTLQRLDVTSPGATGEVRVNWSDRPDLDHNFTML